MSTTTFPAHEQSACTYPTATRHPMLNVATAVADSGWQEVARFNILVPAEHTLEVSVNDDDAAITSLVGIGQLDITSACGMDLKDQDTTTRVPLFTPNSMPRG